jgi:hypothetical protein
MAMFTIRKTAFSSLLFQEVKHYLSQRAPFKSACQCVFFSFLFKMVSMQAAESSFFQEVKHFSSQRACSFYAAAICTRPLFFTCFICK